VTEQRGTHAGVAATAHQAVVPLILGPHVGSCEADLMCLVGWPAFMGSRSSCWSVRRPASRQVSEPMTPGLMGQGCSVIFYNMSVCPQSVFCKLLPGWQSAFAVLES
jgi:hypothetical protein